MSGHPLPSDTASASASTEAGSMTGQEIDETLAAMARSSAVLLQECEAAQQRMEELDALSEAGIEQRAETQGSKYDTESVLLSVRLGLANRSAKAHRDAAREFICWWLDASLLAWKSAVHGTPLPQARLNAAAPNTLMTDDELSVLPSVDKQTLRGGCGPRART